MSPRRTALITGGASGMGLEVALCLLSEGWLVYIVDLNAAAGASVVEKHPGLNFIQVNVTSWSELSAAFDEAYKAQGRLDFVFANAGIAQMDDFFAREETLPPVEPPQHSIDINLKAVINTCHLARHYFQASEKLPDTDFVLIATASIGSFYAQEYIPIYTASKFGVLGFIRSVSGPYHMHNIRTYAICPGTVKTNLLSKATLDAYPSEFLTPMETITSTVRQLIRGGELVDAKGRKVSKEDNFGLAVELFGKEIFIQDQQPYTNDGIRQVCEGARLSNQKKNLSS